MLHVGTLDRPWLEPKRPIDVAIQAHWLARRLRFDHDREVLAGRIDLDMLPFGDPPRPRYDDFSHTAELITQAYAATAAHLDAHAGAEAEESPPMPVEGPLAGKPKRVRRVRR